MEMYRNMVGIIKEHKVVAETAGYLETTKTETGPLITNKAEIINEDLKN